MQRIRALLEARAAEKNGEDPGPYSTALRTAGDELIALERDHAIPFAELCKTLDLPPWLRDALVLVVAPHLDYGARGSIARYWGRESRTHVDAALAIDLLCATDDQAIAAGPVLREGGPLHAAALIESAPLALMHFSSRLEHELVPTPRLLRVFDGEVGLDPRFKSFARLLSARVEAAIGVVAVDRLVAINALVSAAHRVANRDGARVLFAGSPGAGKLRIAQALAAANGRRYVLAVEGSFLPSDPSRLGLLLRALAQEAEILGAQLVLRRVDNHVTSGPTSSILRQCIARAGGHVWCTSDIDPARMDAPQLADVAITRVSIGLPDVDLRRMAWAADLTRLGVQATQDDVNLVAAEYPLSRAGIETAARVAHAQLPSRESTASILGGAAESQMRGQLERFAKRSRSRVRLDQLVLTENTENTREQVHELRTALQRRTFVMDRWGLTDRHATGRGIVTLFNGAPGTGKTMCAAALANEIDHPLYRIDVSNLVDRFVGETEKNLVRMFDEAAASRAALLFDEADSLFGKRVEAKDSTDRHANMQVNLLLNLIEDYDGFVVLTTNLKGSLDDAFLRRIVYKIVFEMPEHDELVALWEYHLPSAIPRGNDVDLDALAEEFSTITGGDIKNAVLRAALAAGGEQPITQNMLRRSVINELRANGGVVADRR
ncbi:MAG: ATP-binding protein [Kofleriaceae bacterium]